MCSASYFDLPSIYALVIGINKYSHYSDLKLAVNDANAFSNFLTDHLKVPKSHIINLRDKEASRQAILDAFDQLGNMVLDKKDEEDNQCAIVIYFAGHGTRQPKPKDWTDWVTVGDKIEALCPSDMGEEVTAIPDRTIAAELNKLSDQKGNNITLILDCCCSAGITRGSKPQAESPGSTEEPIEAPEGYVPRYIPNPPPFPDDCDKSIVVNTTRGSSEKWGVEGKIAATRGAAAAQGFMGKYSASHILLAASGREQRAYEHPKQPNAVFTYSLLQVLKKNKIQDLTYSSLMHKLNMPKWQTFHCMGEEKHRRLFNHRIAGADAAFILGIKDENRKLTLHVGEALGIKPGTKVSVHESNLVPLPLQPNPSLGTLVVKSVGEVSSQLAFPPGEDEFPVPRSLFYCKVTERPTDPFTVTSNDLEWLRLVFSEPSWDAHAVTVVDDESPADMVFTVENATVYVDQHFLPLISAHIGTRTPFAGVEKEKHWMIREVVRSAIDFRDHLYRTNASAASLDIRMELNELRRTYGTNYKQSYLPHGQNIIESEPATLTIKKNQRYGMTIINTSDRRLYPYLFYFDPFELSITEWYSPAVGGGVKTAKEYHVDPPLLPNSSFPVGYGEGGARPWQFFLRAGEKKDVGFFKLFVTTSPIDFSTITQISPYNRRSARTTDELSTAQIPVTEYWGALHATVIQTVD